MMKYEAEQLVKRSRRVAYTLSSDGRHLRYSPRERRFFALLPKDGKAINTKKLIERYYKDDELPGHPHANIIDMAGSLIEKIEKNKEPFRVKRTDRRGPHPIEFWVERR